MDGWMDGQMDEWILLLLMDGQANNGHYTYSEWYLLLHLVADRNSWQTKNNLKDSLQQTQSSNKQKEKDMEFSIANI